VPETCETVTIETENGPVDINKTDLTKDHKLHKPGAKEAPAEQKKTPAKGKASE